MVVLSRLALIFLFSTGFQDLVTRKKSKDKKKKTIIILKHTEEQDITSILFARHTLFPSNSMGVVA